MNDKPGLYIYVSKGYNGKRTAMELQAEKQAKKHPEQTVYKYEEIDLMYEDVYNLELIMTAHRFNKVVYGTSQYSVPINLLHICQEVRECRTTKNYIIVIRKKPIFVFEKGKFQDYKIIGVDLLKR